MAALLALINESGSYSLCGVEDLYGKVSTFIYGVRHRPHNQVDLEDGLR